MAARYYVIDEAGTPGVLVVSTDNLDEAQRVAVLYSKSNGSRDIIIAAHRTLVRTAEAAEES